MAIGAIPPVGGVTPPAAPAPTQNVTGSGFGKAMAQGIENVAKLEQTADVAARDVAAGGPTSVHELMTATAQAKLGVEMLVQVRNRAVEAYQEIMRLQV